MSENNIYDDAYDEGYKAGKEDDLLENFAQSMVEGYYINDFKLNEAYNSGYRDGQSDHLSEINANYKGKNVQIIYQKPKTKPNLRKNKKYKKDVSRSYISSSHEGDGSLHEPYDSNAKLTFLDSLFLNDNIFVGVIVGSIIVGIFGCDSCLKNHTYDNMVTDFNLFTGLAIGALCGGVLGSIISLIGEMKSLIIRNLLKLIVALTFAYFSFNEGVLKNDGGLFRGFFLQLLAMASVVVSIFLFLIFLHSLTNKR